MVVVSEGATPPICAAAVVGYTLTRLTAYPLHRVRSRAKTPDRGDKITLEPRRERAGRTGLAHSGLDLRAFRSLHTGANLHFCSSLPVGPEVFDALPLVHRRCGRMGAPYGSGRRRTSRQ